MSFESFDALVSARVKSRPTAREEIHVFCNMFLYMNYPSCANYYYFTIFAFVLLDGIWPAVFHLEHKKRR